MLQEKHLEFDCYWMDTGWFEGGWPHGVGNWFPRRKDFPNGLKEIGKTVHKSGAKFLLWFEPERVTKGSWLHREHPEWLLHHAEGAEVFNPDGHASPGVCLLNLGNPEARTWLTDHISNMIEDYGIDIYRHDANIDPLDFWPLADTPDRQGITEIRHVEGLYSFWEELKKRNPGLLVECCCSGNRRFDLETMHRCVNLWRSDYGMLSITERPEGDQCHTYGLSFFVVLHGNGCGSVENYRFHSMLGPGILVDWDPSEPDFPLEKARNQIALHKQVRPYFYGDYYPLTPYSTHEDVWIAYQFDRPDMGEEVIIAFRRASCLRNELVVEVDGLLPDGDYELRDVAAGTNQVYKGRELNSGLRIQLNQKQESSVLVYHRIDR